MDQSICRVCLNHANISDFDWHKNILEYSITVADCFCQCTQLLCAESLSHCLCQNCEQQLLQSFAFIKRAQESDKHLRLFQNCDGNLSTAKFEWVAVHKDVDIMPETPFSPFEETVISEKLIKLPDSKIVSNLGTSSYTEKQTEKTNELSLNIKTTENQSNEVENKNHELVKEKLQGNLNYTPNLIGSESNRNEFKVHIVHNKTTATTSRNHKQLTAICLLQNALVQCAHCNITLERKKLRGHIQRNHSDYRQLLLCHACPSTFKDSSTLRQHTLTHEKNRQRNYKCTQCGRQFFTHNNYSNHIKTHDTNREPHFKCDQCDKSFFHKGSLKLHMKRHTGNSVQCQFCQKSYLRPIDLEIHLRSHSGDMPYKCKLCEKSFTQMGSLNKHIRYHEGYKYKCDICRKEYSHQSSLIQHRMEHTGLPLQCDICQKKLVKKSKMRRHVKGVHKIQDLSEIDSHIVKLKTKRKYRERVVV